MEIYYIINLVKNKNLNVFIKKGLKMFEQPVKYKVSAHKGIYEKSKEQIDFETQQNLKICQDANLPTYDVCPTIIRAFDGTACDTWCLSLDEVIDFCVKQKDDALLNYLQPKPAFFENEDAIKDYNWNLYTTHVNQNVKSYEDLIHYLIRFQELKKSCKDTEDKIFIKKLEKKFFEKCDNIQLLSRVNFIMKRHNISKPEAIVRLASIDSKREEKYLHEEGKFLYLLKDDLKKEALKAQKLTEKQKEEKQQSYLDNYFFHINCYKIASNKTYDYTQANLNLQKFLMYSNPDLKYLQEKMLRGKILDRSSNHTILSEYINHETNLEKTNENNSQDKEM